MNDSRFSSGIGLIFTNICLIMVVWHSIYLKDALELAQKELEAIQQELKKCKDSEEDLYRRISNFPNIK